MQLLGKSSYIFYLVHIGVFANLSKTYAWAWVDSLFEWLDNKGYNWWTEHLNDTVLYILIVFILLNLLSILLYKTLEEPINLAIRKSRLLEKKSKPNHNQIFMKRLLTIVSFMLLNLSAMDATAHARSSKYDYISNNFSNSEKWISVSLPLFPPVVFRRRKM